MENTHTTSTEVEILVRPSQPDCILALDSSTFLSLYYKQLNSEVWNGGIGIHKRSDETAVGLGKETQFDYIEDVGLFDGKIVSRSPTSLQLLAATVQKSLRTYDIELSE